jgi:regulator of PEP synthase PpsR (kinase-PPPase family)
VFIVSDATGETANHVLNAALRQFGHAKIRKKSYRRVETIEKIEKIVDDASKRGALVFCTFVYDKNRDYIKTQCRKKGVLCIDILGEPINALSEYLEATPKHETTLGKRVTDDYFTRIDAIEFFLTHDDGIRHDDALVADVVILGVSRSGKSPLSLYLAQKGFKVINIPFVKGVPMPEVLDCVDRRKIIGLIIKPERLFEIRKKRLQQYRYHETNYADMEFIHDELKELRLYYRKNKVKKIMDITNKAIEETATEVIDYLESLSDDEDVNGNYDNSNGREIKGQ